MGNRTSQVETVASTTTSQTYTYPATSNRLDSVSDGGGSLQRDFTYNADGHLTQDVRAGTGTFNYVYDDFERLSEVRDTSGTTLATYGYDGFERRVSRTVTGGESVHYIFDASGRPLAEHDAVTGAVLREYIWLNDLMVGMVESGQLYAVHGGHLGQPLMMTDFMKVAVWDAEFRPFGGALPQVTTKQSTHRFPGQWEQGEADLFQNWHRDYDPTLGRYPGGPAGPRRRSIPLWIC